MATVNAKADGTAQGFNLTNAIRPTEVSISNLRAAWQGAFLQNLVKHNIDSVLKDKNAPVARQREAVIEKYKGTAEWLMAPNGAKSNLDENQWVTARTPAFKRWLLPLPSIITLMATVVNANKIKSLPPRKPLAEVVGAAQYRGGLPTGDAESISQQGGGAQGEIRPSIKKREEREKGVGAQKDSQQFKRWFADSKVVDENGEPLVVYRGSPYDPLAQEAGKGVMLPLPSIITLMATN